jgi:hypothetical protein
MLKSQDEIAFAMNYYSIDYRCEDGRFPVFARCVTISSPYLLSCIETRANPGIRIGKNY